MLPDYVVTLAYLLAAVLFVFGLKGLSHPRTAVRGNLIGAVGMLIAVVVTLLNMRILEPWAVIVGLVIGGAVGAAMAIKVRMTAMPQLVGLLNGFGGGASVLVAGASFILGAGAAIDATQFNIAVAASGIIGAVTFWGSLIAFSKLEELWFKNPVRYGAQHVVNALLGAISLGLSVWLVLDPAQLWLYWVLVVVASALGVLLVIPIGGADMPVVITLLNSYSGLAACATGFVLSNNVLIISGSLVGASGIILTRIMCRGMNRSLANVMFGTLGPTAGSATADEVYAGKVKSGEAEEIAMLFDGARRVVIVPGYGMAVAQAQYAVRDLTRLLESRGTKVEFGVHPVAGRMPGHMNVLLAEANIPYDQVKEMDEINATMAQTDVALVVGANDVVNPVARTDPASPIAGMPIIDVDKARTVVVIKRSLSPGFAGIPNPLFAAGNTIMYFADAKKALLDLIAAIKAA